MTPESIQQELNAILPASPDRASQLVLDYLTYKHAAATPLENREAIQRLDRLFPHAESHLVRLCDVFDAADEEQKRRILRAHAGAFGRAVPRQTPLRVMRDLVALVSLVRNYRSLEVIVPLIGQGEWGAAEPILVADAVAALYVIARNDESYLVVKNLAASANFKAGLVLSAYKVMIRGRPSSWAEDFTSLLPSVHKVSDATRRRSEDPEATTRRWRELALTISEEVPLPSIAAGLDHLDPRDEPSWRLVRSLLGPAGPLVLKGSRMLLSFKGQPGGCVVDCGPDSRLFDALYAFGLIATEVDDVRIHETQATSKVRSRVVHLLPAPAA